MHEDDLSNTNTCTKIHDARQHPMHHHPKPPDGGWGWVIVLGSFVCHMLTDGAAFSSGVLFTRFLDYFKKSHSSTSWVSSVFIGIPLICGPITSSLTVRFGCRRVTIVGGLLTIIGFLTASFANSIEMICLTYGVISGIGMSFIYVPAVVIVAFYFEKKRAFATGLAVCGSGIGTATFAPLTEYLLSKYDWRVTLLIFSGIFTIIIMCGVIFRPLTFSLEERQQRGLDTFNRIYSNPSEDSEQSKRSQASKKGVFNLDKIQSRRGLRCYSTIQIPTFLKSSPGEFDSSDITSQLLKPDNSTIKNYFVALFPPKITSSHTRSSVSLTSVALGKYERKGLRADSASDVDLGNTVINVTKCAVNETIFKIRHERDIHLTTSSHYSRVDIFYPGNPANVSLSCPDIVISDVQSETSVTNCYHTCFSTIKFLISEMTDFTDLKNPLFLIFSISNFILYFWYDVPYVFLGHHAIELGSSASNASLLITIIGIFNTVGQILFGHVADRKDVNTIIFYATTIIVCGISVIIMAFGKSYVLMAILAGFFGFFVSSNYAITTLILVDFVGMQRLTKSYGVLLCMTGVANLIGPPFAGWLYDLSGNYDNTFLAAGGCISLSGAMVFICLISRIRKYRHCHVSVANTHISANSAMASSSAREQAQIAGTSSAFPSLDSTQVSANSTMASSSAREQAQIAATSSASPSLDSTQVLKNGTTYSTIQSSSAS